MEENFLLFVINILSPYSKFLYNILSPPLLTSILYILTNKKKRIFSLLLQFVTPTLSSTLCHSHGGDMKIDSLLYDQIAELPYRY